MASSLDMPKKPRRSPVKKAARQGVPSDVRTILADYRFERVQRDPSNLEREIRTIVGRFILFRTAETPKGSKEEYGPHGLPGQVTPVEFVIMDSEEKWIERDIAETWGRAEQYGRAFARVRDLDLVDSTVPFRPTSA